jgi:hypothetical protein
MSNSFMLLAFNNETKFGFMKNPLKNNYADDNNKTVKVKTIYLMCFFNIIHP